MGMGGFRRSMAVMVGAFALASMTAMAQAPQGGPPPGGPRGPGMGMGMGMGMMGAADRPTTIERLGLNDAALKLTAAQKGEIDKIVDAFLAEQKTLNEKYPMAQGQPMNPEGMTARRTARENMTGAINKVLNEEQRKTWEAAQAARRPMMGPGGPGGPGAGARGPGGPPPGNR